MNNRRYPIPKDHELSEAEKRAIRGDAEDAGRRGEKPDCFALSKKHHCSPSQVAGIIAWTHMPR